MKLVSSIRSVDLLHIRIDHAEGIAFRRELANLAPSLWLRQFLGLGFLSFATSGIGPFAGRRTPLINQYVKRATDLGLPESGYVFVSDPGAMQRGDGVPDGISSARVQMIEIPTKQYLRLMEYGIGLAVRTAIAQRPVLEDIVRLALQLGRESDQRLYEDAMAVYSLIDRHVDFVQLEELHLVDSYTLDNLGILDELPSN